MTFTFDSFTTFSHAAKFVVTNYSVTVSQQEMHSAVEVPLNKWNEILGVRTGQKCIAALYLHW